ncbi:hypothetical protein [Burkholderia glumae]|uniref:hypothetical protein n=1 Tax=Burkholderia glumae TaxID=337 RepID=UPI0020CBA9A8|nr:hypothetical protein [Burkholderia glumae]MCQ0033132.1 hypothetical protein [Burkholderia glumae]MCQ0038165.1 hypothetical protein [Burkholderia glumae]
MTQHVDVEFSRHRVSLFLEGVKTRFEELKSRDFPNSTPIEIIELIKAILDLVAKSLEQADAKLLPLIFSLLTAYQDLLGYLDNAHTEQTPRGLVCILRQLLQKTSQGSAFFASPQAAYNYGIADVQPYIISPLKNLLSPVDLQTLPGIANSPIRLILFPRAERDNILAHAVFGHEIGHIIAADYLDQEATTPEFQVAFGEAVDEAVKRTSSSPSTNKLTALLQKARVQAPLSDLRKRAMEELISDYVGTLLFGPSALLASYEIFSFDDLDVPPMPNDYYPPSRYRLRFVYEALKEQGFVDAINALASTPGSNGSITALKTAFDRVESLANNQNDLQALSTDAIIDVAYTWVANSLSAAKNYAQNILPAELIYTPELLKQEVPELIQRLALKVPPDELGVYPKTELPAWQSALLAGWAFSINGKHTTASEEIPFTTSDFDTVRKLVLRAIEGIDLQKEYKKYIVT